jgi:DNA-binding transcriptional LysR family regulator
MFELSKLRCFVAVAEELHFGRAAARLNMTQPPLSRQIQLLEHTLDAVLLERTSRTVRLTPAGRNFLPEAKRILRLSENAAMIAKRIATGKTGSVKIGFTAASAYRFLPELVAACRAQLEDIDLSLKEMVTVDQIEAFETGQIDVGLLRPPVSRPELQSFRVVAEPLVAALPVLHPLAKRPSLSIKDFDGLPFVMYAPHESRYFHDLLVAQFAKANVLPRYVQQLTQIHSILALVRAGLGAALVPEAASTLRFQGVVLRPLTLRPVNPVELLMVWRRDQNNPALDALLDVARGLRSRR